MTSDEEQTADGSDADWEVAEARAGVFRCLLAMSDARERSRMAALAIKELAISRATFYRLLGRFRAAEVTSAVLPGQAGRKVGSRFLDAPREAIIAREISQFYLRPERPRLSQLVEQVQTRCHEKNLPPTDWRTIAPGSGKLTPNHLGCDASRPNMASNLHISPHISVYQFHAHP
jgi:putative transposase